MSLIRSLLTNNFSKCYTSLCHINSSLLLPASMTGLTQSRVVATVTRKRRKTYPFWWWPKIKDDTLCDYITESNKQFLDDYIKTKYTLKDGESPLKAKQFEIGQYCEESQRSGVIAKKIGVYPMWTKTGRRLLTTVLQVVDNHVIKYHSPEEFQKICRPFYRYPQFAKYGVLVVGAESDDPRKYHAQYLGMFDESGVMPKKKMTRFFITDNSKLPPGTELSAAHFRAGDYVDVHGKTKDYGFQGVVKRFKFRGGPKGHGNTKTHRRGGNIGIGRKLRGPWKGAKMPGHMGSERSAMRGVKIWRINYKYNILWVHGPAIPGPTNSWCYVFDTKLGDKKYAPNDPPPFPTYFPETAKTPLPEEVYDPELHQFDDPTIIFVETEAEKKAAALALRAKVAKKAKIK